MTEELLSKAFQHGPWFVFSMLLVLGLWKGGKWVGREMLLPLRDRLVTHLQTVDASIASNTESLGEINDHMHQTASALEDVSGNLRQLRESCESRTCEAQVASRGGQ